MGYTPLFDSLTSGTLCGRWPDIGLWPIVLSLADKNGVVDVTPTYIASITGLEADEVVACMERFCAPDPYSRSREHEGARLVLLDPERNWGWQVVNHGKYREKARLAAKNAREVESGINKERMSHRPPLTADDRRSPTPQTQTQTKTKTEDKKKTARRARVSPTWKPDESLLSWLEGKYPDLDADELTESFLDYHIARGTTMADWNRAFQTWARNADRFAKQGPSRGAGRKTLYETAMEQLDREIANAE